MRWNDRSTGHVRPQSGNRPENSARRSTGCSNPTAPYGNAQALLQQYFKLSICGVELSHAPPWFAPDRLPELATISSAIAPAVHLLIVTFYQGSKLTFEQFSKIIDEQFKNKPKISFLYPKSAECRTKFYPPASDSTMSQPLAAIFFSHKRHMSRSRVRQVVKLSICVNLGFSGLLKNL
jgi:hypothetical protein